MDADLRCAARAAPRIAPPQLRAAGAGRAARRARRPRHSPPRPPPRPPPAPCACATSRPAPPRRWRPGTAARRPRGAAPPGAQLAPRPRRRLCPPRPTAPAQTLATPAPPPNPTPRYTEALSLAPASDAPGRRALLANRSAAALAAGRLHNALADADAAAALAPGWPKAHWRRGRALAALGRCGAAWRGPGWDARTGGGDLWPRRLASCPPRFPLPPTPAPRWPEAARAYASAARLPGAAAGECAAAARAAVRRLTRQELADCLLAAALPAGLPGAPPDWGAERDTSCSGGAESGMASRGGSGAAWAADPLLQEVLALQGCGKLLGVAGPPCGVGDTLLAAGSPPEAAPSSACDPLRLLGPEGSGTSSSGGAVESRSALVTAGPAQPQASVCAVVTVVDAGGRRLRASPRLTWEAMREAAFMEVMEGGAGEGRGRRASCQGRIRSKLPGLGTRAAPCQCLT
jgi:hypothetical protein